MPYKEVRKRFCELRERMSIRVTGFGDMTPQQVSALTHLPEHEAVLARERDFSEPFVFDGREDTDFLKGLEERGLRWTRGMLFCVMGQHDKGQAVRLLKKWYGDGSAKLITMGLGDAGNDEPMLREVDVPVLVQKSDGSYDESVQVQGLRKAPGIGPEGWSKFILSYLGSEHAKKDAA